MKASNKQANTPATILTAVFILTPIIVIIGVFVWISTLKSDEPTAKDLSLTVTYNSEGLLIANQESVPLTNCKVILNNDYTARTPQLDETERVFGYRFFTKDDGERFDILAYKPQSVAITDCKEDTRRFGYYEW